MPDREKVIKSLKWFRDRDKWREGIMIHDDHAEVRKQICDNVIELLKEQEAVVKQWTKEIADNQLAHAPNDSHEFMSLDEHLENEYKRGIWDGLQIAWNIISEGR